MSTFWGTLGTALQPVLIAVATVTVFALLRLITPVVRWGRRLKQDGEIYGSLPDGREKELWAASVTAQAERLRIYREDLSIFDQAIGWYAFATLALTVIVLTIDGTQGWPAVGSILEGDLWATIFVATTYVVNLSIAIFITVRLIRGRAILLRAGRGGYYPKYDTLRRIERKRKAERIKIERRAAYSRRLMRRSAKNPPSAK